MIDSIKKMDRIIPVIVIVGILAGGFVYSSRGNQTKPTHDYAAVKRANITEEVNATGKVKAAQSVDMAFERVGKITEVHANVGDRVTAGAVLAAIDNSDLKAQLDGANAQLAAARSQKDQFEAALEAQNAKLDDIKSGTRPEEMAIAQTGVMNAEKALDDAKANLDNIKNQTQSQLVQAQMSALDTASQAVSIAINSVYVATNIQTAHFNGSDLDSLKLADAKASAVLALLGQNDAGRWNNYSISQLNGGTKALIDQTKASPTNDGVNNALSSVDDALNKVKIMLNSIPITSDMSSAEIASITVEKGNTDAQILAVNTKEKAIGVQATANATSVSSAQTGVDAAESALNAAQNTLILKQAGATKAQIEAQEAQVRQAEANVSSQDSAIKQAEANVENVQAQFDKTMLRAPIDGVITRQDADLGKIVSANVSVISIMDNTKFQIEANIAEADIAKVKTGETAKVTLDAYGNGAVFDVKVINVDPAETVVNGISTYKTTFEFTAPDDRIKSGMTANINIITASHDNALIVPQRAVITKDNDKYVMVDAGNDNPKEQKVEVGIKGSDGNFEILSGLSEGDKVVSYGEMPK